MSLSFFGCISNVSDVSETEYATADSEQLTFEIDVAIKEGNKDRMESILIELYNRQNDDTELALAYSAALISNGKLEEAEAVLDDILANTEQPVEEILAKLLLQKSSIAVLRDDLTSAAEFLRKAEEAAPEYPLVNIHLGFFYYSENNWEQAKERFEKVLQNEPDNIFAVSGLGRISYQQENYQLAIDYYNKAIELNANDATIVAERAGVWRAMDKVKEAENDYTLAIELDKDNIWNYIDRGKLRLENSYNLEGALRDINFAIEIQPENDYLYFIRAPLYKKLGHNNEAIADYQYLINKKPDYTAGYQSLADLLYVEQRWREAADIGLQVFEIYPAAKYYLLQIAIAKAFFEGEAKAIAWLQQNNRLGQLASYSELYAAANCLINENSYSRYLNEINNSSNTDLKLAATFYMGEIALLRGQNAVAAASYSSVAESGQFLGGEKYFARRRLEQLGIESY